MTGDRVFLPLSSRCASPPDTSDIQNLREHLNVNLCDKRSSVTELKKHFPSFDYSYIKSDEDNVWKPTDRETDPQLIERAGRGFNEVLEIAGKDTACELIFEPI
jgi:hypothetical protein